MEHDPITEEDARRIRERRSPAFAGYVTDGNVSDRDALATLMDLVVKGYLGIDADASKTQPSVKSVYIVSLPSSMSAFERRFVDVLFGRKKTLTRKEVTAALKSKGLKGVIKRNLSLISKEGIKYSGINLYTKDGKRLRNPHWEMYYSKAKKPEDLDRKYKLYRTFVPPLLWIGIFFFGLGLLTGASQILSKGLDAVGPFSILSVFLLLLVFGLMQAKENIADYESSLPVREFETNQRDLVAAKEDYADLFNFIKASPLKKARLYNEFMPYTVAFGLDTSWNDSFGITKEGIADPNSSAFRGDSLEALSSQAPQVMAKRSARFEAHNRRVLAMKSVLLTFFGFWVLWTVLIEACLWLFTADFSVGAMSHEIKGLLGAVFLFGCPAVLLRLLDSRGGRGKLRALLYGIELALNMMILFTGAYVLSITRTQLYSALVILSYLAYLLAVTVFSRRFVYKSA